MIEIEPIHDYLLSLQGNISDALLSLDGTLVVQEDKWQREGGGSGCSRVLSQGQIFEKAGGQFFAYFWSGVTGVCDYTTTGVKWSEISGAGCFFSGASTQSSLLIS